MKKFLLYTCAIFAMLFMSCQKNNMSQSTEKQFKIITTIFPEYDWTKNIVGTNEKIDIQLLMKNGTDLHSFNPSAKDIIEIACCDILIYVGGESDQWISDALKNKINKNMVEINLMSELKNFIKEEEIIEGMEADDDSDEIEYDEHVWLSVKNAKIICEKICIQLSQMLPEYAEEFQNNFNSYKNQLDLLDTDFAEACSNIKSNTLLFCDRFPFRYFTDDYGLNYYAAFVGCSADSEASFKTIAFLSKKIDQLELEKVYVLDGSNKKIATTVINSTKNKNQNIFVLDSMQFVTWDEIKNGKNYISVMRKNLETLK